MSTSEDQGSDDWQQPQQTSKSSNGGDGEGSDVTLPSTVPLAAQALSAGSTPLLLASLVDLREACRLSLLCRLTRQAYCRRSRKVCLTMGVGVPDDRRLEYWKFVLNVRKEMADKTSAARNRGVTGDLYESCLYGDNSEGVGMGALLPPSGVRVLSRHGPEGEISRDVGRTFPSQPLFQSKSGPGQNMLANVLKAFMKINLDVGYCQGMNFLAGALLLACSTRDPAVAKRPRGDARGGKGNSSEGCSQEDGGEVDLDAVVEVNLMVDSVPSWEENDDVDGSGEDERQVDWRSDPAHMRAEKDVFWLMMALTSRLSGVGSGLGMRELWLPGVPQLKVRVFQFDKLLLRELPRLYNHFRAKQLQLEVLVSQWFLTLFSYSLRPPMLLRVLDLTFTDGWKAMFRFGLARLRSVENTLCELELEGVSRFLRGFREPDSLPPFPVSASVPWYQRHFRGGSGHGPRKGPKNCYRGNYSTGLSAASISVLRATGELKVTRSTLRCLQKDFAVQLLKEHLQGEGQWLTRYGSAPEPTPGAGAGVVGGAADGDVGFMGVEAMTRMMLSDAKLLGKLKDDLAGMAAPLQADARVFQTKITEASERHEGATKLKSSLTSELLILSEDIDALKERKKLVAEQMHLLLVQFEHDSAREEEEEQRQRRQQQEEEQEERSILSDSDSDNNNFTEDSDGHGNNRNSNSSSGSSGSKSRSTSLSSLSSVALSTGVRVSPSSSSEGLGSAFGGIGNEIGNGPFGSTGWFGGGGGSLSFGADGSVNGNSGSSCNKGCEDNFRGVGRSREETCKAGGGGDGNDSLSWQAFFPSLPPPPSALAETVVATGRTTPREIEGTSEERPRVVVGDDQGGKTARSLTKRVSMISSGTFSHPVVLWGGGEGGGAGDAARRGGDIPGHPRQQQMEDDRDRDRNNNDGGGPTEGTAWRRLAKWVGGRGGGEGGGDGRGRTVIKKRAPTPPWSSTSSSSQWFAPRVGSTGIGMASAVVAATTTATATAAARSGAYLASSPPRSRSMTSRSKSVGVGRRRRRSSNRGKEKAKQKPSTLMEELYKDLGELRRRLESLQTGIDEKSEVYATVSRRYSRAMVEAEEAHELKLALSEQMLQLLLEQEQRMEGFLRDWVTFENEGAGYLAQPPPAPILPLPLGMGRKGSDADVEVGRGRVRSKGSCDSSSSNSRGGGFSASGGGGISYDKASPRSSSNSAGDAVGTGVSTGEGRSEEEGDVLRISPVGVSTVAVKGDEEGDGFEKVESWMASADSEGDAGGFDESCTGDAEGGDGNENGVGEAGSLLVPFPSS